MATLGGLLADAGDVTAVDSAGALLISRFPYTPMALGYLVDPELDLTYSTMPSTALVKPFIAGALAPEGVYLEPQLGQIWPR